MNPCDYAACTLLAAHDEDGWHFCPQHYREHRADLHGERWPQVRLAFPPFLFVPQHGTEAAYRRHHRAGEAPCVSCTQANRRAKQVRAQRLKDAA